MYDEGALETTIDGGVNLGSVSCRSLVCVTHYFLHVSAFTMVLSPLCLLTYDIVALGIAVRVAYRNCTAEHGRKVAASFGGMLSLVSRISGAVVVLAARPVYMFSLSTLA